MVLRIRNGPKLCEQSPCARGMPWAQQRPKTRARRPPSQNRPAEKGQNGGCAIALMGGCGEVGPPDSKWGQTLLAASVCPRDVPGTAAPKNERPKAPVPKPPSGKGPKRGVCYSLGGGVGLSWSAGLGMGPNFASGLHSPVGCPGHSRAKKREPNSPVPKPPSGKGQNWGVCYSLGGRVGEVGSPDSEWAQPLRAASVCPCDTPGTAAPKNERPNYPIPKPPSGKGPKRGVCYSLGGEVGRSWSSGFGMGPNFATGLRVPAGCPGHRRAKKQAHEGPRPKTAQRKRAKTGGVL